MTQDSMTSKLTKFFESQSAILCAILYGSFATGKTSPQSDVDIGVFCVDLLSAPEKLRILEELSLLLAKPVDLVDLRTTHPPLSQEILTKGIYLKLTDLSVKEHLIKKMLYEVADFLPLKRRNQINKLNNIKNCLDRIETKKPFTLDQLKTDWDLQDIISVNLQRVIQASVDLATHICSQKNLRTPKDMADAFFVLKENGLLDEKLTNHLAKSVGLRNVLVHEYNGLDWEIVFHVTETKLDIFKKFISVLLKSSV